MTWQINSICLRRSWWLHLIFEPACSGCLLRLLAPRCHVRLVLAVTAAEWDRCLFSLGYTDPERVPLVSKNDCVLCPTSHTAFMDPCMRRVLHIPIQSVR